MSDYKPLLYDWVGGNIWLFKAINSLQSDVYDTTMRLISQIGDYHHFHYYMMGILAYVVLMLLIKHVRGSRGNGQYAKMWFGIVLVLVIGFFANGAMVKTTKRYFEMPRPYVVLPASEIRILESIEADDAYQSFPSGHVTFTVVMVVGLWPVLSTWGAWLGVTLIAAMCWSRIAVGMHFPADVLGGMIATLILMIMVQAICYRTLRLIGLKC